MILHRFASSGTDDTSHATSRNRSSYAELSKGKWGHTRMEYTQRIQAVSPAVLRIGLPVSFRIMFGAFTLFIGSIMFVDGSVAIVPFIMFLIALGATLFVNEWDFDSERAEIRHRIGWLVFSRMTALSVSELSGVRHTIGTARRPRQAVNCVAIETRAGRRLTIDLGPGRARDMEDVARLIARHLEIDFLP